MPKAASLTLRSCHPKWVNQVHDGTKSNRHKAVTFTGRKVWPLPGPDGHRTLKNTTIRYKLLKQEAQLKRHFSW
jgi:hypothetical protein